jgi:hypothetical protein
METTTPVTNDTRIGDMASYFRWNEETRTYEMNIKVDPHRQQEVWIPMSSPLYDDICNPTQPPTVGKLIYLLSHFEQRLVSQRKRIEDLETNANRAIRAIGDSLLENAERRDWCAEFDKEIDGMNSWLENQLGVDWRLPTREKEYTVNVVINAEISFMKEITVTARNEEDARQEVLDNIESYVDLDEAATDYCRNNTFDDISFDIDSVEE